ncbi:MAG: F0F1 ATP synthase subunit gamma [Metallibacterium scheffleri]|jgi:F-type H+-transporting ATPase subunit gamma|uniref:F0F1 ATP synthase subunit gamma n=1 Tax=Metallibacterium scheffleri TaxID=993689 RepID=UPI0026F281A1|nr:F0F1 ATP synthase subunit gamma [Metallibacterium scheffleri]MCK9368024.1 F0F1 ATP synthase subunit gamma [Metallibacterium scheffleri]
MANAREIRSKIRSTQNMRKVTRALEMVSASKIRKAQDLMRASRPYARLMRQVVGHIAKANTEYRHPFMARREAVRRVGYLVISSDRGLCGGLNANLQRRLLAEIRAWRTQGVEVDVVAVGQKALQFFRRLKDIQLVGSVTHLGERPRVEDLIGVIKVLLDAYTANRLDRVFLAYNDFINTMSQKPVVDTLLPLPAGQGLQAGHDWDYLYEPDAPSVLDPVLKRYIEALVYQGVLENLACEHAARMVAMKSASDNANKLIETFTLIYNKARQAAITQEISEIVSGAAAV